MPFALIPLPDIGHSIFDTGVGPSSVSLSVVDFPCVGTAVGPRVGALTHGHVGHKFSLFSPRTFPYQLWNHQNNDTSLSCFRPWWTNVAVCSSYIKYNLCQMWKWLMAYKTKSALPLENLYCTSYFMPFDHVKTPCPSMSPLLNVPWK